MLKNKVVQVEKTSVVQNVLMQLIELIMNGTLKHGDKLPSEKQLMELFKVGRSSLREAVRALSALGLVEVRVPEGTFVTESFGGFFTKHLALMSRISFDNIVELIEARIRIESGLAELAASKAVQEDKRIIRQHLDAMRSAENNEQFLNADLQFHMAVAECARNSFLLHVLNILRDVMRTWIMKVSRSEAARQRTIQQHEQIADAISRNAPADAARAMTEHLESVSALLLEIQEQEKREQAE